ncbi:cupredoxin domain-containing protein [Mangrovibrevibacter kandeliae]|uniref:hypothetical protein n=1 Tax=Mangrovibrevibacter kandeliae TaxID=2968473 RepID=UPI00211957DA|nr:hypothetical protein [Aurantimonas sp. CSK15Z-1]MCQ8783150.1 hypothetical protein [Aurantimonas sp. CSK15Z-1]
MKAHWLMLAAAMLAVVPSTTVLADDDDKDDAQRGKPVAAEAQVLTLPKGADLLPASAINGDQIGLPKKSLSSQILPTLTLGAPDSEFQIAPQKDFYLRAGQAYRWDIASNGGLEYKFQAPGFFRNVWMNQIVIDDREIHMAGPPAWLEYDGQGPITVQFQTIRPGRYDWYVEGLDGEQGMKGTITIVP